MPQKLNDEQIRHYWNEQVQAHGQSAAASWSDLPIIDREIRTIAPYLADSDRILDIGCANGYSTLHWSRTCRGHFRGLDYIPEMIEQARLRQAQASGPLAGSVEFAVGDMTALNEADTSYDKVVSVRVVINLGEWERQLKGIVECIRVLKPGGLLLLSEPTLQGWKRLNSFRHEWGLPNIPMPVFNNYLDEERLIEAVANRLHLVELVNFASTYFVGTRVLKPLLIQALGVAIDVSDSNMEWNHWFAQLPAVGDFGTQKLFVFRKV